MGFPVASGGGTPLIAQLSAFSNVCSKCLPGLCKAYVLLAKDEHGVKIRYKWGDEDDSTPPIPYNFGDLEVFEHGGVDASPLSRVACFDEELGRVIYFDDKEAIVVVDMLDRNLS